LEAGHGHLEHANEHREEARRLYSRLGDPRADELTDHDE
jgi:hypothetical protein